MRPKKTDGKNAMSKPNIENLADTYLRYYREERSTDEWSFGEVAEVIGTNVDQAWEITSSLLSKAETERELGYIASGPFEAFLGIYGEKACDLLEQGANGNGRLQLAINRVWCRPDDRKKSSRE